jgi:hypothetical protein
VRASVGQAAYDLNVQQYCCAGLNFGYYYDGSSIVAYDGETAPPYSMGNFTPSTAPGARAPHLWLADGRSLWDALGPAYTLLRVDPTVEIDALLQAAACQRLPLAIVDVDTDEARRSYTEPLVLIRPDTHIAWRGYTCPADADGLVMRLRGALGRAVLIRGSQHEIEV